MLEAQKVSAEARYFAALQAILRVIKRSGGGTVAEIERIARAAVTP